jgi:hypothetical protein
VLLGNLVKFPGLGVQFLTDKVNLFALLLKLPLGLVLIGLGLALNLLDLLIQLCSEVQLDLLVGQRLLCQLLLVSHAKLLQLSL